MGGGTESLEVYSRTNAGEWASWIGKTLNVPVDSTIASRLPSLDFTDDTRQRFTAIARAMLAVNARAAQAVGAPL